MRLFYFIIILIPFNIFSQHPDAKRDYTWVFGYDGAKDSNGVILNFNESPVSFKNFYRKLETRLIGTNSNICDKGGNVALVYNNCHVYNSRFLPLENGSDFTLSGIEASFCSGGSGLPNHQINLILPGSELNTYFLFRQAYYYDSSIPDIINTPFLISKADLNTSFNGEITIKDSILSTKSMTNCELTACRHSNGKDWWILTWLWNGTKDSSYQSFLLSGDSIKGPFFHSFGKAIVKNNNVDQACFSPNGKRYARIRNQDGVYLYDFDRNSGEFTGFQFFKIPFDSSYYCGISFSPNSNLLYVNTQYKIFQYDLTAPNILATEYVVGIYDGFSTWGGAFTSRFEYSYLGPDCKTYICPLGTVPYLHVINYPNRRGAACGFEQRAIHLPAVVGRSLPNYPNFRLGAEGDNFAPCDSTLNPYIVGIGDLPLESSTNPIHVAVYPNPTSGTIHLDRFGFVHHFQKADIRFYNTLGEMVLSFPLQSGRNEYVVDVEHFSNGLYFWQLILDGKPMKAGKVEVLH